MGAKIKAGLADLHATSFATAGGAHVSQNFFKDNHSGNSSSSTHHSIDPTNRNNSNFAKEAHLNLNATNQSKPQAFNAKNNPGEVISGKIHQRSSIIDYELQGYYNPLEAEAMVKSNHPEAVSKTIAKANAKNARLAGKIHPNTGVPFNERGFADFDAHKVADVRINIKSSDPKYKNDHGYIINPRKHMKFATLELRSAIDKGFVDKKKFTPEKLAQIYEGNGSKVKATIEGYRWHHHEDTGRLQLIPRNIHIETGHIGMEATWFNDFYLRNDDHKFPNNILHVDDIVSDNISKDIPSNNKNSGNKDDESTDVVNKSAQKNADHINKTDNNNKSLYSSISSSVTTIAFESEIIGEALTIKDTTVNVMKTVQALMLIIDFTTPEWIKTLILSLHPIKNMQKHFEYPSYDPKFDIELEEIPEDYNKEVMEIIINKEEEVKNEFDESSEKSQREEKAVARIDLKKMDQEITDNMPATEGVNIINDKDVMQRYIDQEKVIIDFIDNNFIASDTSMLSKIETSSISIDSILTETTLNNNHIEKKEDNSEIKRELLDSPALSFSVANVDDNLYSSIIMLYQVIAIAFQEECNESHKDVSLSPDQEVQISNIMPENKQYKEQVNENTVLGMMQIFDVLSNHGKSKEDQDDKIETQEIINYSCRNNVEELALSGENYASISVY